MSKTLKVTARTESQTLRKHYLPAYSGGNSSYDHTLIKNWFRTEFLRQLVSLTTGTMVLFKILLSFESKRTILTIMNVTQLLWSFSYAYNNTRYKIISAIDRMYESPMRWLNQQMSGQGPDPIVIGHTNNAVEVINLSNTNIEWNLFITL